MRGASERARLGIQRGIEAAGGRAPRPAARVQPRAGQHLRHRRCHHRRRKSLRYAPQLIFTNHGSLRRWESPTNYYCDELANISLTFVFPRLGQRDCGLLRSRVPERATAVREARAGDAAWRRGGLL
jgi:hypothetical protein